MIQPTPVPKGGGLTVDLEQLEIFMHNSGRQSRQKLKQQSFIALSRPQVATKTPPMGGGRRLPICLLAGSWIDFELEMIWSGTFEYQRRTETIPPLPSIKKIMHKARRKSR